MPVVCDGDPRLVKRSSGLRLAATLLGSPSCFNTHQSKDPLVPNILLVRWAIFSFCSESGIGSRRCRRSRGDVRELDRNFVTGGSATKSFTCTTTHILCASENEVSPRYPALFSISTWCIGQKLNFETQGRANRIENRQKRCVPSQGVRLGVPLGAPLVLLSSHLSHLC
ncbi:unnamed protein product [Hapterophycus canaliculatus]